MVPLAFHSQSGGETPFGGRVRVLRYEMRLHRKSSVGTAVVVCLSTRVPE